MYRASFLQNISDLQLNLKSLKTGRYLLEGPLSPQHWEEICKAEGLTPKGGATARLEMEKTAVSWRIEGEINLKTERECGRTLELFMDVQKIHIKEDMPFNLEEKENTLEIEAPEVLDVREFLTEQIRLNLTPYPINPATLSEKEGSYDVEDGAEKSSTSPFAALSKFKIS